MWLRKSLEQPTGHWTVQLTQHVCCFHLWGCRFCHGLALSVAVSSPKCHEEKIMYEEIQYMSSWTAIQSIAKLTWNIHLFNPGGKISYARNPASLGTSSCSAARLIHTSKTSASAYITLYSMFLYVLCVGTCNQERSVRYAVQCCLYFKNVSCKTLVNHYLHLTIKLIRLFHLQTIKCINLQSTFKYITQLHLKTAIVLLNILIHQIHMFSLQPIFEKHLQSLEEDIPFRKAPFFYTSEEPLLVHHPDEVLVHWYRPLPLVEEIRWTPVQVDCLAHWWRWRLNLRAGW